ncbi:aldose 1-epimerase [Parasphingorhabdus sp.]|uniref:aldose 1-epimerase n=1 Tax=Parasphingorhabdus sp. TaxID=2709688 RepID=UPI0030023FD3
MIELVNGDSKCIVRPETGGSIQSWECDGQSMFRPVADASQSGLRATDMGCFPLAPFSNRIADGRFDWNSRPYQLPLNALPEPHAHHGMGWQCPWEVSELSDDKTILSLRHSDLERWPWPFCVQQEIVLGPDRLAIGLTLKNTGTADMPGGLGLHPFFVSESAVLHFPASTIWENDARKIPVGNKRVAGKYDFTTPQIIDDQDIDNVYSDWTGQADITWQDQRRQIRLSANVGASVLYIPKGEGFFCLEPVSHITNAINMPDCTLPMQSIAPGASFSASFLFELI